MTNEKITKDDEMARLFIIDKYNLRKDLDLWTIRNNYELCKEYNAYLAGLEAGRQQQSGIGWIDTAHIEIKLHDIVESIKKQLDAMLQELLGGNNKEVLEWQKNLRMNSQIY